MALKNQVLRQKFSSFLRIRDSLTSVGLWMLNMCEYCAPAAKKLEEFKWRHFMWFWFALYRQNILETDTTAFWYLFGKNLGKLGLILNMSGSPNLFFSVWKDMWLVFVRNEKYLKNTSVYHSIPKKRDMRFKFENLNSPLPLSSGLHCTV